MCVTNKIVLAVSSKREAEAAACRCGFGRPERRTVRPQDDLRAVGQRARDGNALLHSTGQCVGIRLREARETNGFDEVIDDSLRSGAALH